MAVLRVRVGEDVRANLARAQQAMETLQRGKRPKAHFAVGFAEVGQMLAVFTPKRWELIAKLREIGPVTTAQLARARARLPQRARGRGGLVGVDGGAARQGGARLGTVGGDRRGHEAAGAVWPPDC
jgi:hypothetical protein